MVRRERITGIQADGEQGWWGQLGGVHEHVPGWVGSRLSGLSGLGHSTKAP